MGGGALMPVCLEERLDANTVCIVNAYDQLIALFVASVKKAQEKDEI